LTAGFFAGLERPVDFYVIRHGQSEGNAGKILQGRGEYTLSETGRAQAAERGRLLKSLLAAHGGEYRPLFFSSPQRRAAETAQIITAEAGLPEPEFFEDLMEMELGIWTGKNWDEVKNNEPSLWQGFRARSWDAIPGAETSAVLYERSLRVWAALRDTAKEQGAAAVFVVTHGGLIQWLLKTTLGCKSWFPLFPISNCGLFKLCVEPVAAEKAAYLCWEEINSSLPNRAGEPRGFPS
jgi:broad specificity phosphatase PhoE